MNTPALILLGTIALSLLVSYPMRSLAQEQPPAGQQSQEQFDVPLNFSLKVKGLGDEKNASSTGGGKDVTVTLNVQNGQGGSPTQVPLTAKVSNDTKTQDLEFCVSLSEAKEMCQSLEQIVKAQGENQTSDESSNETSASGNSPDKNNDNKDN
ncbi:MAG: hypothetical protein E6L04_05755 [Thaumarchaeota archaeon]|nr:MAG: hypothetical protein E6L04_05755 [Nitrososphaerota archaeon]